MAYMFSVENTSLQDPLDFIDLESLEEGFFPLRVGGRPRHENLNIFEHGLELGVEPDLLFRQRD